MAKSNTPRKRTVSVVIPTYNRADAVSTAIDSVLSQDLAPDEVIVVDDGSTDNTRAVLSGYGNRIIAIHRVNGGAGAARNTGVAQASGDWLAFLDSDDLWLPGRLAALNRDLDAAGDDIVGHTSDLRFVGPDHQTTLFKVRGWDFASGGAREVSCPLAETLSGVLTSVTALRRDCAVQEGGFGEHIRIFEDGYLFCPMALRGPWLFTGDVLAELRRLPGDEGALSNINTSHPVEAATAGLQIINNLLDRKDLPPDLRNLVQRRASGALFSLAAAEAIEKTGSARKTLLASARRHPEWIRGWLKALPPLILGRRGYDIVLSRKNSFTRS
jgi:hypothetical protein